MPPPFGMSNLQYFRQWDLSRGLISDQNPLTVGPGGATTSNNFIYKNGYLVPRPSCNAYGTQPSTKRATYHIGRLMSTAYGTADKWILIQSASNVTYWWVASGGGSWSLGTTGTAGYCIPETDGFISTCQFNNIYYMCTGDSELVQMTHASNSITEPQGAQSNTALKAPKGPRLVAANSSHLFLANCLDVNPSSRIGSTRVPYRIYWSDTLNATVWNGGVGAGSSGIVDLADEPDAITALWAKNENIIAFKRRNMYMGQFVGPPLFYTFRRAEGGVGCISPHTLKEYKDGLLIWLGDDGVYIGGVGRSPQMISGPINQRIKDVCYEPEFKKARAIVDTDDGFYHLFLPNNDPPHTVDKVFTFSLNNGSWWEGTLTNSIDCTFATDFYGGWNGGATVSDFWGKTKLIVGTDGTIYYFDSIHNVGDALSPFTCSWTSGYIPCDMLANDQARQVNPQTLRIFGPSTVGTVTASVAGLIGFDHTLTLPIPSTAIVVDGASTVYAPGRGGPAEFLQVSLSTTATTGTKIAGYEVGFIPEGDTVRKR